MTSVRQSLTRSLYPADTSEPVSDLTVGDLLRARAADSPDVCALVEVAPPGSASLSGADRVDRRWNYSELLQEAEQCAHWLASQFRPGQRITVWAPNVPEWIVLQYGAALAGLVLVTANPALRADELRYVLAQSRSDALFHVSAYRGTDMDAIAAEALEGLDEPPAAFRFADWDRLVRGWDGPRGALPPVAPEDPCQIQYTSGTTGAPKGALLHHRGLVTNARYIGLRAAFPHGGVIASAMPLFHTAGCGMSVLGTAHIAGTLTVIPYFEPGLVLRTLEALRADVVFGVPTMLIALIAHPNLAECDLSSCSIAVSGGSSVPPELVSRVERLFGCRFSTVFGQTELSPVVTQTSPDDSAEDKAETVGRPLWNVDVKIADLTGAAVPVGEQGEICARGYQRMIEYFDMPEATAQTIDQDGWVHTGDLGTMDARGYLRVTGRLKVMIIRGGENIYPREIEERLFTHPAVEDVAVVGLPDEHWGERVAAVLRLRPGAPTPDPQELRDFCRGTLAPHKTPVDWYVTDEFPLTGSGKVQKFRIADLIAAGAYTQLDR